MSLVTDPIWGLLPYWIAGPLWLAALVALGWTGVRVRRSERSLAVLAVGLAVLGFLAWPGQPGEFSGQVVNLRWIVEGSEQVVEPSSAAFSPPALRLLAGGLKELGLSARWLVRLGGLLGLVWLLGAGLLASRIARSATVGLLTVALLGLDPHRLTWSASAYHVAHPTALLVLATVVARDAVEEGRWGPGLLAGLVAGLGVGMRIELAPALPLLALGAWVRRPALRVAAAFGGGLGLALLPGLAGPLGAGMLRDAGWSPGAAWPVALVHLADPLLLHPWLGLGGIVAVGASLALGRALGAPGLGRRWLPLLAACALPWAVAASFDDAGPRHLLAVRTALIIGLLMAVVGGLKRQRALLAAAPLLVFSIVEAVRYEGWIARGETRVAAELPLLADPGPGEMDWLRARVDEGCLLVTDLAPPPEPWFNAATVPRIDLLVPARAAQIHTMAGGCLLWLQVWSETRWNWTFTTPRIERLWTWEPIGRLPDMGVLRVLRWRPGDGATPVPATAWARLATGLLGAPDSDDRWLGCAYALRRWATRCEPAEAGPAAFCAACAGALVVATGEEDDPVLGAELDRARSCAMARVAGGDPWVAGSVECLDLLPPPPGVP